MSNFGNFIRRISLGLHGIRRRNDMKITSKFNEPTLTHAHNGPCRSTLRRRSAIFPSLYSHSDIEDEWHRILTGRQSPEPVSKKLKMIYGQVVAEKLPPEMLDLLSRLDNQSVET